MANRTKTKYKKRLKLIVPEHKVLQFVNAYLKEKSLTATALSINRSRTYCYNMLKQKVVMDAIKSKLCEHQRAASVQYSTVLDNLMQRLAICEDDSHASKLSAQITILIDKMSGNHLEVNELSVPSINININESVKE